MSYEVRVGKKTITVPDDVIRDYHDFNPDMEIDDILAHYSRFIENEGLVYPYGGSSLAAQIYKTFLDAPKTTLAIELIKDFADGAELEIRAKEKIFKKLLRECPSVWGLLFDSLIDAMDRRKEVFPDKGVDFPCGKRSESDAPKGEELLPPEYREERK